MKRSQIFYMVILFMFIVFISFSISGSDEYSAGDRREITVNGVKFGIRYIPSGSFMMGSPETEAGRWDMDNEDPQRNITISKGFWMMETEVTQELYLAVMGNNPSNLKGNNLPVEQVSWNDAVAFCHKLSELTGETWNLPTEAEWEYACRAGTTTAFHYGNRLDSNMANFNGNYPYGGAPEGVNRMQTVPVKSFEPNAWGLYDMHGNVWEWCSDWYGNYISGNITDPKGPSSGEYRVLRGGGWGERAQAMRSASRVYDSPDTRYDCCGFRAVLR